MTSLVHKLFFNGHKTDKQSIAISFGDERVSYSELEKYSNQYSNYLIAQGVKPGDVVGVCFERSIEGIISLLAILKAGASYLPLDPDYPSERLDYMIQKAKVELVIGHECLSSKISGSFQKNFFDWSLIKDQPELDPVIQEEKIKAAYIIFTSGSTGMPKGVEMGHAPLVNLIKWQNSQSSLENKAKTLQFTPLSFDVHFQEIFSTLSSGGELVLVSKDLRLDSLKLLKFINHSKVNRLFLPFVALNHLCEMSAKYNIYPEDLKEVITAGEQLKITKQVRSFFKKNRSKLYNHYGPSETHVITSYKMGEDVDNWDGLPPIGEPISNCEVLILDEFLETVKKGMEGELYLRGVCLANGYIHDEIKTAQRFLNTSTHGLIYKSGDIGKLNENNEIVYIGRSDGQVKIRGHRVEISEVEIALESVHEGQGQIAVKIIENSSGEKSICAYIIGEFRVEPLRDALAQRLPEYMIPSHFIGLDKLPLTASGKLDRNALPLPGTKRPELNTEYLAPKSTTELLITSLWSKELNIDKVGIRDSFFDLGGTSLKALNILAQLQVVHGKNLNVTHLFQYPTIEAISKFIDRDTDLPDGKVYKKKASQSQDIAIIGMSARFPGVNNLDELWDTIINQKNNVSIFEDSELNPGINPAVLKDATFVKANGQFKGFDEFDCRFFGITPREAQLMDPQQRKMLEICNETLELAGYSPDKYLGDIGIFAGSANNSYQAIVQEYPEYIKQVGAFNVMLANEKDYIATRVAHKLNLTGPALSVHTGCSTSLVAVIQAVKSLRDYDCDMALAGGVSISGQQNTGHNFQSGGILSKDGVCRPYDSSSTGTIFTDGIGIVLLKRLDDAINDGDDIQGVIKGVGINNDGADKMSFTAPSINGQKDAILRAQTDAEIVSSEIDFIEGHGTATPVGDPIEVEALRQAFRHGNIKHEGKCYLGSLKSNLGHLTAAAGVAGLIKAVLVAQKGIIPATANLREINESIDLSDSPIQINKDNIELKKKVRTAGISSFGVGGTNAHVIIQNFDGTHLENYPIKKNNISNELFPAQLIKLSSKTSNGLEALEKEFLKVIKTTQKEEFENIAYTLDKGRSDYKYKRAFVLTNNETKFTPVNSTLNNGKTIDGVGFMLPGQGSQYLEMGKNLLKSSKVFRDTFNRCCHLIAPFLDRDIREVILGNNDEGKSDLEKVKLQEAALRDTYYTQPAIFIIEYSLGVYLMSLGVRPNVLIGHSIGEFSAAALAGVFTLEDGLKMIAKRGELMRKVPKGSMLSVALSFDDISKYLKENIQVAAINNEQSIVLAGSSAEIEVLEKDLLRLGISAKMLHTSHAFHSKMMDPVVGEYETFLKEIQFKKPQIKMYSTVTEKVEVELFCSPQYWANHLRETVRFAGAIKNVLNENNLVLCEVGPRTTLKSLAKKMAFTIGKKDYPIIHTLGSCPSNELDSLKRALGEFWVYGTEISTDEFYSKKVRRVQTITNCYERKKVWLQSKIRFDKKLESNKEKIINNNKTIGKKMDNSKKEFIMEKLSGIFEEASGIDVTEFSSDTSFLEMGMDSLFLTQVALNLKNELKADITFRQLLEEYSSISLLADSLIDSIEIPVEQKKVLIQEQIEVKSEKELKTKIDVQNEAPVSVADKRIIPVSTPSIGVSIPSSGLEGIIQRQLELMGQQIQLLSGNQVEQTAPTVQSNESMSVTPVEKGEVSSEVTAFASATQEKFQRGTAVDNAKKAFGACARINTKKETQEDVKSRAYIDAFFKEYILKTKGSKNFTQTNRKNHADPRAVTGFKPESKEIVYPIVVEKSQDQYLWDVDGNRYVDMTCGFGSNFFGNGNKRIKELVKKQLEEGIEIGPQHPLTSEVSKLICELTNSERAAFCNTGSEAVLGAMRVARTVTGRQKIIVFNGSYHGICDEVIIRGSKKGKSFPAAPGITNDAVSNMIVLDYGTEESLNIIREMASEVAAVLVEPVQSRRSDFHPKEFLQEVRKITIENNSCLIFDEVITGFRIHPGGAQAYFDVKADLATYGKIVGGGMPIGVIAGKSEFMDALDGGHWQYGDDSTPTVGVTYFAGTFVRHPLALAAAKGALEIIKDGGEKQLNNLNEMTQKFVDEINLFCAQVGAPIKLDNFGSLMKPKWEKDYPYSDVFFAQLRYNGIHVYDGFPWFVNLAHVQTDLDFVVQGFKKSIGFMQLGGLMEGVPVIEEKDGVFDSSMAPVQGAKLGRNAQGAPAWYIENPNITGEYIEVK